MATAMASRKKRGYADLDILPTPRDPKRSKSDNRTSLQALSLHHNNDAEILAGTMTSSSPTLITSFSSSASSQTSALSDSDEPTPSLLASSDDGSSESESDEISSSDSENPSSSSLELNGPALRIPMPHYSNHANRDTDSSSSSSSDLSSSSSESGSNDDPASSDSGYDSNSGSSPSSDSPSSSSSLARSPVPLTSQNLSTLQSRLSSFLPTMQAANERLEVERAQGKLADRNIANVREDQEVYIEMDLGLGVLEEKTKEEGSTIEARAEGDGEESSQGGEKDVLGRLMGKRREKPGIEVL